MATTPSTPSGSGYQIPEHILDDLCSRFIINIPEEERQNMIRLFFQVENAHWFYLDFYCKDNSSLKAVGIKEFSSQIFRHCPTLVQHADDVDLIHGSWKEYKLAVPTYGAIILDDTLQYCLLVQGFWARATWGFPKGKVNEDEAPDVCAVREVYEETGFDISRLIDKEEYIEYKMHGQSTRLYLVAGVSRETEFAPKTRNEIRKIEWFEIDQLPASKKDTACKDALGLAPNSFFMVMPFIKSLRKWVSKRLGIPERSKSRGTSHTPKNQEKDLNKENKSQSEKKRNKQQEKFAQQNQQVYQEYMKLKEAGMAKNAVAKGQHHQHQQQQQQQQQQKQHPGASPNLKVKSVRNQATSPAQSRSSKQHLQILQRDGTLTGSHSKKSLGPMFEADSDKSAPSRNTYYIPEAWRTFRLDVNAVMSCFYGKKPSRAMTTHVT